MRHFSPAFSHSERELVNQRFIGVDFILVGLGLFSAFLRAFHGFFFLWRRLFLFGFCLLLGLLHGQLDPFFVEIDFHDSDLYFLLDLDDIGRILDETVLQFADMDQSVLMDSDVYKCAKGSDVGNDAR